MKSYNAVILGGMCSFDALLGVADLQLVLSDVSCIGGGTGKSSLTLRYMKEMFVDSYDPTIEGARVPAPLYAYSKPYWPLLESYRKTVKVDGEMCNVCCAATPSRDPASESFQIADSPTATVGNPRHRRCGPVHRDERILHQGMMLPSS